MKMNYGEYTILYMIGRSVSLMLVYSQFCAFGI